MHEIQTTFLFARNVLQNENILEQLNIAKRKVSAPTLRAGLLHNANICDTLIQYFENDQAYAFTNPITSTPTYWKKFQSEVLAMVKQLGVPTFFLTLSSADLRWNELAEIIQKLNKADCNISNLSYHDRCSILSSKPVIVARHFQYRVEIFFKKFIIDGPLGKSKYYAIQVEFQIRGSPHTPKLSSENRDEYTPWFDGLIKAETDNSLFELVFQIHRHSKCCRKYKNDKCRFNIGRVFTYRTIIAKSLSSDLSESQKKEILLKRKETLNIVPGYINEYLILQNITFMIL